MSELSSATSVAGTHGPQLIWAFAFDDEGRATPISDEPKLGSPPEGGFLWAHVDLVHADTQRWFVDLEPILGAASDSMIGADFHPHVDWTRSLLWGAIDDVDREFLDAGEQSADLRFALSPHFLITARRRPLQSAHALKRKIETGAEFATTGELFQALIDEIVDAIARVASRSAKALERIEDRVLSTKLGEDRAELPRIRREIARFARLATSLHAVIGRLEPAPGASLPEGCQNLTARLGQRASALHSDIQYLSDRARMLNEEVNAQAAAQTNRHLFTLTILTTLLLPPSLVTGYFGMNTKNLLFGESEYGTIYASVLVIAAAASVYLLMRRNRMLG